MRHIRHGQAELAGALAIDVDVERRIVVLLRELQIAQEAELGQLRLHFLRVGVIVLQADSLHRDFDGRRRAEAHHLGDDIARFEGDVRAGQFACRVLPAAVPASASPRGASGFSAT